MNDIIGKDEEGSITGIDIEIKANLAPQIAFKRLPGAGNITEDDAEKIIEVGLLILRFQQKCSTTFAEI